MEMNEQNINQLEKFKEKLEKSEEVKETKKRGRKKKIEEDKQMKVEKATETEKTVQEVEAEKPVENEKVTDKLKSEIEFRLIYWNDIQKEFDHLEYRIYKGIKKDLDEVKEMQKKILSVLGYDNDVFNNKQ